MSEWKPIESAKPKTLLEAYNDGIGDGLVAAAAIMNRASNTVISEIQNGINEKRRRLRLTMPNPRPYD